MTAFPLPRAFANRRIDGITPFTFLLVLVLLGLAAIVVMRILPIYLDYYGARTSLEGVRNEPDANRMSPADIRRSIARRFDIGYVTVVKPQDIKIIKRNNDTFLLLKYEDRRPFLSNLELIASFEDEISLANK